MAGCGLYKTTDGGKSWVGAQSQPGNGTITLTLSERDLGDGRLMLRVSG